MIVEKSLTQQGVISRAEVQSLGLSGTSLSRYIESGYLIRVLPGVYRVLGVSPNQRMQLMAAVKWLGEDTLASHRSAAILHSLEGASPGKPEVTTQHSSRKHPLVIVHQAYCMHPADFTVVDEIPVTKVPRTLLDLGQVLNPSTYEIVAESAIRQGLITVESFSRYLNRFAGVKRKGSSLAREFVRQRTPGVNITESVAETKLLQILRRAGLGEPKRQWPILVDGRTTRRMDFAFPEHQIGIEYDSWAHHLGRQAFIGDRVRNNDLAADRWQMFYATAEDLRNPQKLLAQIRRRAS